MIKSYKLKIFLTACFLGALVFSGGAKAQMVIAITESKNTVFKLSHFLGKKGDQKDLRVVFFNTGTQRIENVVYLALPRRVLKKSSNQVRTISLPYGCILRIDEKGAVNLEMDKSKISTAWVLCPRQYLPARLTSQQEVCFVSFQGDSLVLLKKKGKTFFDEKKLLSFFKKFQKRRLEIHKNFNALLISEKLTRKGIFETERQLVPFDKLPNQIKIIQSLERFVAEITFLTFGLYPVEATRSLGDCDLTVFIPDHFFYDKESILKGEDAVWILGLPKGSQSSCTLEEIAKDVRKALEKGNLLKTKNFKELNKKIQMFSKEKSESIFVIKQHIIKDGGIESLCERAYPYGIITQISTHLNSYLGVWDSQGWVKRYFSKMSRSAASKKEKGDYSKSSPFSSSKKDFPA